MDHTIGKFKLTKSDNFEAFLTALGVGFIKRKLIAALCASLIHEYAPSLVKVAVNLTPVMEISKEGDTYHVKTKTTMKTTEFSFVPGVEFEETRQDDVTVKSVIVAEAPNKWVQTQTPPEGEKVTIVREFEKDGVSVIATVAGVTSNRYYTRQE